MRYHTDRMREDSKFQLTKGVSGLTIPRDTRYRRVYLERRLKPSDSGSLQTDTSWALGQGGKR